MKKFLGLFAPLILVLLLATRIPEELNKFFKWLIMLEYNSPNISFEGGIIVRILTFLVSYGLVGLIFNYLGFFNSDIMSIAYFIISTILGFVLTYVVWTFEKYSLYIFIALGVILFIIICYFVFYIINTNKNDEELKK